MNRKWLVLFLMMLGCLASVSGAAIPKDSKVLGATKGKAISTGLVFIDGKYIEPPYVVQRWGCGIKINKYPVIGEAVAWGDFMKTQSGVKVVKTDAAPSPSPSPAVAAEPVKPAATAAEDLDTSLDDLFDDDPKPAKPPKPSQSTWKPKPAKAAPAVSYSMEGKFEKNDAVKALVKKVNAVRSEIDAQLRMGGFICFGENYSRVSGDSATALKLLEKIPDFQRSSETAAGFSAKVRGARMEYLPDGLCEDLFRNKVDYRKLQERRAKWREEAAVQKMLDEVSAPIL